jgi:hypothetical protein
MPSAPTAQHLSKPAVPARGNAGYGQDSFSAAVEMVATPGLFILLGLGLDRLVGTPWYFGVAFGAFAVIGTFVKQWFVYSARMTSHDEVLRSQRENARLVAEEARAGAEASLAAERADLETYLAANRVSEAEQTGETMVTAANDTARAVGYR